jgi:RNA polymerase sigma-70 factor (ECF subfamily)
MKADQTEAVADASSWVDDYGDALFRYAMARVHDRDVAEDLVQETFLSALSDRQHYRGEAAFLTWLTAILHRKTIDYYRRRSKERELNDSVDRDSIGRLLFDRRGGWRRRLGDWPNSPHEALEREEFWGVMNDCLSQLPHTLAAAFHLREIDACETAAICRRLDISATNLSVRLHRARSLLRRCLELRWFKLVK